jgi:hypothetical protein
VNPQIEGAHMLYLDFPILSLAMVGMFVPFKLNGNLIAILTILRGETFKKRLSLTLMGALVPS